MLRPFEEKRKGQFETLQKVTLQKTSQKRVGTAKKKKGVKEKINLKFYNIKE